MEPETKYFIDRFPKGETIHIHFYERVFQLTTIPLYGLINGGFSDAHTSTSLWLDTKTYQKIEGYNYPIIINGSMDQQLEPKNTRLIKLLYEEALALNEIKDLGRDNHVRIDVVQLHKVTNSDDYPDRWIVYRDGLIPKIDTMLYQKVQSDFSMMYRGR